MITWDRALPGPGADPACLWAAGFIANRREIGCEEDVAAPEIALRLYKRFALQAPRHIAGPFAWILWDAYRQCLVAVRDRLGVHEIYVSQHGDTIHLAGGIEPLLAAQGSRAVNPRAVLAQIHGRAPAPRETFYRGIGAVEPGGFLVVYRDRLETGTYWRPEPRPLLRLPDDAAYARAFLDTFLPIAAEYTPRVPAGITLSGGLDSTTVAAAVREAAPDTSLTAFSWIAPELPEADESRAAEAVCRKLRCPLVTIAADQHWTLRTDPGIRPEPATPLFNFYNDLWEATFRKVCEHGVDTLFSGLSGDHLFGGDVFSYPDLLLTGRWWKLASEVKTQRRYSELSFSRMVWRMVAAPLVRDRDSSRPRPVAWLGENLKAEAFAEAPELPRRLLPGRRERLRMLRDPLLSPVAAMLTAQAARHGIELRHPLLDHRLFEFAAALPAAQTFAAGTRKVVLRNAMRGRLPDEVIDFRGKTYPAAIARRGLRERERAKVWGLMTDMRAAQLGFVDEKRLRDAYGDYLAGRNDSSLFWYTLTLEAWLRRYFA